MRELTQVRHLLAVVQSGTIYAAARSLQLSQSALSRSIQKLEKDCDTILLERGRKGALLTPAGERFVLHARAAVWEMDRAHEELTSERALEAGSVRVGVSFSFEPEVVPQALSMIWAQKPNLRISVVMGYSGSILNQVQRRELDFALALVPTTTVSEDLQCESLFQTRTYAVARRLHPLARKPNASVRDALREPWILLDMPEISPLYRRHFEGNGLVPPTIRGLSNSLNLAKQMVLTRDLLSFFPQCFIAKELKARKVVLICPAKLYFDSFVGIVTRRNGVQSPAAQFGMEVFRRCAGALPTELPK